MFPNSARVSLFLLATFSPLALGESAFPQIPPVSTPDQVFLQLIVVPSFLEAQQILERLSKGDDFSTLAKELSIDPSAANGGFLGPMSIGSLRAELQDALRGVAPGQFSKVVQIPSGFAVLKIAEAPPGHSEASTSTAMLGLNAGSKVKLMPLVFGLIEADEAFRRYPKADGWQLDPHTTCEIRKKSLSISLTHFAKLLAPENRATIASRPSDEALELYRVLGELYSFTGDIGRAIPEFLEAYQIAQSSIPDSVPLMEESLAILYLHKAQLDNRFDREPRDRCLFPMHPSAPPEKKEDFLTAISYFLKCLERKPDDVGLKWLLNLSYMMLGQYPARVPQKYLLAPSLFESKEDVGRFVDVAPQAGLDLFELAGGLIVDDFENNGQLDVVTSSFDLCTPMHFFHNNGDGTFTDRTKEAGLSDQLASLNMFQADYNNDGCVDILMLRGAWEFPQRLSLLRNNCDGTFTDVTVESGLANIPLGTQAAVWADINNDGFLDLFVGNENGPSRLFLNKGDGTFQDISASSGLDRVAYTKAIAAGDYDGDGFVDFYVSNLGRNFLYHNNHDNTFTEVAQQLGVVGPGQSFATWFFDYDNDGLPDLFVAGFSISVDDTVRGYLGLPANGTTPRLYKNLGGGKFADVTREVGLAKSFMPMGANFGDIDNDGYLDFYLNTGSPSFGSLAPSVLFRNHDGKYFVDVTSSSGTGELHKGHAVAFADIERNGHIDLITEMGGAVPGDSHALRLFHNPGNSNNWINLKLIGVKTNRSAIGTRITLTVRNPGEPERLIYRWVNSGGSFGASPLEQHIGLGKSAVITSLQIDWPVSKTTQRFKNVAVNQFLSIKEFDTKYVKLERKPLHFVGAVHKTAQTHAAGITSLAGSR